jgi:hypothetical protein
VTLLNTNNEINNHQNHFKAIQKKNCDRSKTIMENDHLRNVVKAWRNVTNWIKANRAASKI